MKIFKQAEISNQTAHQKSTFWLAHVFRKIFSRLKIFKQTEISIQTAHQKSTFLLAHVFRKILASIGFHPEFDFAGHAKRRKETVIFGQHMVVTPMETINTGIALPEC